MGSDIEWFCLVLDAKAGLTEVDTAALDLALQTEHPVLILINKVDKLNQKDLSKLQRDLMDLKHEYPNVYEVFYYSAKTKKGVDQVRNFLSLD